MNCKFLIFVCYILTVLSGTTAKLDELDNNLISLNSLDNLKNQIVEIIRNNEYLSLFQTYLSSIGLNYSDFIHMDIAPLSAKKDLN